MRRARSPRRRVVAAVALVLASLSAAAPASAAEAKARPAWRTSATFGLETIYDDNFLRYSDDYLDAFRTGAAPWKFRIDRADCHILAASLELEARRRLLPWGDTRLRGRFKRWQYVQESIKTNEGFWWYARQYMPGGRSVELAYSYAPEQYIRQLSVRPPWEPPSAELQWDEFRYTRNEFAVIWRDRLAREVSYKLDFSRTLRYYNQLFMENDIFAWGVRATLYLRPHRDWRLTLDYGYEDAPARGYNEVGETKDTSDDSDPSYEQDLYQVAASWRPRWLRPLCDAVDLRAQYQAYWFTSDKVLADDPYHVGRKDEVYAVEFTLSRGVGRSVDVELGMRWGRRTVDSPWRGDIAEDKDYTQHRYWLGLAYEL